MAAPIGSKAKRSSWPYQEACKVGYKGGRHLFERLARVGKGD